VFYNTLERTLDDKLMTKDLQLPIKSRILQKLHAPLLPSGFYAIIRIRQDRIDRDYLAKTCALAQTCTALFRSLYTA